MAEEDSNEPLVRKQRIVELDGALAQVADGMTVAIGGFINASHPMLVVRGLIKRGIKDLTLVGAASSGLEIDLVDRCGMRAMRDRALCRG